MEFNLNPYKDSRLDITEIYSFMGDFRDLEREINFNVEMIKQQYARMEASAKAQKLAIGLAEGILVYNARSVSNGYSKGETYGCEQINSSMECTTNVSKEIMIRDIHDLISTCEKLKQKAEDLLRSPVLEKTDFTSELDEAIAKCDAWLAECKEREQ